MITLYRPAYYTTARAPEFTRRSIDTKPVNVENGAVFKEINTGAHIDMTLRIIRLKRLYHLLVARLRAILILVAT